MPNNARLFLASLHYNLRQSGTGVLYCTLTIHFFENTIKKQHANPAIISAREKSIVISWKKRMRKVQCNTAVHPIIWNSERKLPNQYHERPIQANATSWSNPSNMQHLYIFPRVVDSHQTKPCQRPSTRVVYAMELFSDAVLTGKAKRPGSWFSLQR